MQKIDMAYMILPPARNSLRGRLKRGVDIGEEEKTWGRRRVRGRCKWRRTASAAAAVGTAHPMSCIRDTSNDGQTETGSSIISLTAITVQIIGTY